MDEFEPFHHQGVLMVIYMQEQKVPGSTLRVSNFLKKSQVVRDGRDLHLKSLENH